MRPAVGIYLWTWVSMMNLHMLTYGFGQTIPFAFVIAIVTVLGFVFTSQRKPLPINGGTVMLLLLISG